MYLMKLNILPATCFLIGLSTLGVAHAEEFVCKDILFTRQMGDAKTIADNLIPRSATLYLDINVAEPSRSTLRWIGSPAMEDTASTWPAGTRIIAERGVIAASFAASKDGISSVGTATLDAAGALRVVENTITQNGQVMFDILQASCHKGRE